MRYRFVALRRDTGEPLRGHVEADNQDQAFNIMGENGIVVEMLEADPEWVDDSQQPGIVGAIENALNASSTQIPFDSLRDRFGGKDVWVIDREKIKRRVVQTVDEVVRQNQGQAATDQSTRDQITEALERLFGDNRNLTSPISEMQDAFDVQISRLAVVVRELEHAVGAIRVAVRGAALGTAPRAPVHRRDRDDAVDAVLQTIFDANVALRRRMSDGAGKAPQTISGE